MRTLLEVLSRRQKVMASTAKKRGLKQRLLEVPAAGISAIEVHYVFAGGRPLETVAELVASSALSTERGQMLRHITSSYFEEQGTEEETRVRRDATLVDLLQLAEDCRESASLRRK